MFNQVSRIIVLLVAILPCISHSDVLKLPSDNNPQVISSDAAPVRGMTKQGVENEFGQPNSKSGPVGDPAIYRWNYAEFIVVFENNHVIHTVVFAEK